MFQEENELKSDAAGSSPRKKTNLKRLLSLSLARYELDFPRRTFKKVSLTLPDCDGREVPFSACSWRQQNIELLFGQSESVLRLSLRHNASATATMLILNGRNSSHGFTCR